MKVKIEKQEDGTYIAYNIGDEDFALIGTGDTVTMAKEDFFNSIKETKEVYKDCGEEMPVGLESEPTFIFDLSSLFEYYSVLNVSAFARLIGINEALMRQYKRGNTYISDVQLRKIEAGIHKIGKEFQSLQLV